jgi:hypothetical protein
VSAFFMAVVPETGWFAHFFVELEPDDVGLQKKITRFVDKLAVIAFFRYNSASLKFAVVVQ